MRLLPIWEKYFLKQLVSVFFLFLIGFYAIYVLIDYSNHASSFKHYHFSFLDVLVFYGFEFTAQANILLPFALLIAFVKTLCSLNVHNELVALLAGGIPLKKLLRPFICFAFLLTALLYLNEELFEPLAAQYNTRLEYARAKAKQRNLFPIQHFFLEDGSELVFQTYDIHNRVFSDVYWILSIDELYRMERLTPSIGYCVEHLKRDAQGDLVVVEQREEWPLEGIRFHQDKLIQTVIAPNSQALSILWNQSSFGYDLSGKQNLNEKEALILTTLYYKLALPWICLLAILAPAPFCLRFSRTFPLFLIYAFSIFGLVFFYLAMDAAAILGERQAVSPAVAIWTPFALSFLFFGYRFFKVTG